MRLAELPLVIVTIIRRALGQALVRVVRYVSFLTKLAYLKEYYQYHYEHTTTSSHQATGNTSSSSDSSGNSTPARRPTTLSGNLSLHELNNRLERYIQQIRLEPESNPTIINYERHT